MKDAEHQDGPHRRAGADLREGGDHRADQQRVDEQHAAVAEAGEDFLDEQFHADRRGGLGHHQQPRLPRREAHPELIEQRQQEGHAGNAEAGDESAGDRHAEGSQPEQLDRQQRLGGPPGVPEVGGDQGERDRGHRGDGQRIHAVFAEDFQNP